MSDLERLTYPDSEKKEAPKLVSTLRFWRNLNMIDDAITEFTKRSCLRLPE